MTRKLVLLMVLGVVCTFAVVLGKPTETTEQDDAGHEGDNEGHEQDDKGHEGDAAANEGDNEGHEGDDAGHEGDNEGHEQDDKGLEGDDAAHEGDNEGHEQDDKGQEGDDAAHEGDNEGHEQDDKGHEGENEGHEGDKEGDEGDKEGDEGDKEGHEKDDEAHEEGDHEYYEDEEEPEQELEPLKPVTCPKGWFSGPAECWKRCGAQGGTPGCCDVEGPEYKCECLRIPVIGGGGLKDLNPVNMFKAFKTGMACGMQNTVNLGRQLFKPNRAGGGDGGRYVVHEDEEPESTE